MAYKSNSPQIEVIFGSLADVEADLLVVSGLQGAALQGGAQEVDKATGGLLQTLIDSGSFKGRPLSAEWIYPAPIKCRRILLIGAGKSDQYDVRMLRRVAAASVRLARGRKAGRVCLALASPEGMSAELYAQTIADGVVTGLVDSDLYKDQSNKGNITHVSIWHPGAGGLSAAADRGRLIGEAVNFARWLGDEPANVMTPERVAQEVSARASEFGVSCEVLDEN